MLTGWGRDMRGVNYRWAWLVMGCTQNRLAAGIGWAWAWDGHGMGIGWEWGGHGVALRWA